MTVALTVSAGSVAREDDGALERERLPGREQLDDPKLIAILDDIELRAAVELAKLSGPNGL